jgi:hypothetical protein
MAIFRKGRLYHFAGLKWDHRAHARLPYEMIVIGDCVRTYLDPVQRNSDFRGEFVPDNRMYRIDDGHLPDHQPRVAGDQLATIMGAQAIRFAYPVPA